MQTNVNGKTVTYTLCGEEHAPETVALFLHGWGSRGELFGRQLTAVGEKYLTVAPDLPGFGGSDEPSEAWSVDDYVDFTLEFLKQWSPKKVILFGHSFGGRMSIKLASREGLPFAVEKVVLFDAAGVPPKRGLRYRWKVRTYKLGKAFLGWKPVHALFPNALEALRASRGSADYNAASPIMRACLVKAVNEDLTPYLPQIHAPTLLIWGAQDTATPISDGELMEKLIPDAGLVRLPQAGHFSFADDPLTCERVLRSFLQI